MNTPYQPPPEAINKEVLLIHEILQENIMKQSGTEEDFERSKKELEIPILAKAREKAIERHRLGQIKPRTFAIEIVLVEKLLIAQIHDRDSGDRKEIMTQFFPEREDDCYMILKELAGAYIRQVLMRETEYAPDCQCKEGYFRTDKAGVIPDDPETVSPIKALTDARLGNGAITVCPNPACKDYVERTFTIEDHRKTEVILRSPRPFELFSI